MKINRTIAICAFVVSFSIGLAVASEVRLTSDPSTPAAVGKAHLNKEKNGNLKLKPTKMASKATPSTGRDTAHRYS
jgi:hypothetical protein